MVDKLHKGISHGGIDVVALRRRLRMSQRRFAGTFGLSVGTLRHWELGNRRPTGTALVLLHTIATNPRAVRMAVMKVRARRPGMLPGFEPTRSGRAEPGCAVLAW